MSTSRPNPKGQKAKAFIDINRKYTERRTSIKPVSQLTDSLTLRIEKLEAEMSFLKQRIPVVNQTQPDWLTETFGVYAEFPEYDQVIEYGQKYRASLHSTSKPKSTRKASLKKLAD